MSNLKFALGSTSVKSFSMVNGEKMPNAEPGIAPGVEAVPPSRYWKTDSLVLTRRWPMLPFQRSPSRLACT